uniref:Hepcidin n=1 Tax=Amphiprion percula TaxID=161767 RepID=A0A3P8TSW3_AMPPE
MLKTFSVAVAVVLSFIFIQESSAVPVMKEQELEESVSFGNPSAAHKVKFAESGKMPHNRQKRGFKCKLCCNCCKRGVCGLCCKKKF